MGNGLCRALALFLALAATASCTLTEARRERQREALVRRLTDTALIYNEAYSSAISGQILLNIMRAHRRQPRQYMSMSGFTNDEPDSRSSELSVSDLPLGELGEQWGMGGFTLGRSGRAELDFQVEPFGAAAYSNVTIQPTSPDVFRRYWESGWNRDMLLLLLVDRVDISRNGVRTSHTNSAGSIVGDCDGEASGRGCAFVNWAREFAGRREALNAPGAAPRASDGCAPAPAPAAATPANSPAPASRTASADADDRCQVEIRLSDGEYSLTLRSLDEIVYYLGELLRQESGAAGGGAAEVYETRLRVLAPGAGETRTPLFRIVAATPATTRDYATTISFDGRRYSAGAPEARYCRGEGDRYPPSCGDQPGDRSSTVLEFLISILAHNQSDAAVQAPEPQGSAR